MMVCDKEKCTACYACINICPKKCITIHDFGDSTIAKIDSDKCIKCNLCKSVCQSHQQVEMIDPFKSLEGWVANDEVRQQSSSGGFAAMIMMSFIKDGGYVAACLFKDGEFKFELTNKVDEVKYFVGSKYVKSKTLNIYSLIKQKLNSEKVLFIGLPCQVVGIKLFLKKDYENLYTIDLICHGTPSQKVFKKYYSEKSNISLNERNNIVFRKKHNFQVYCDNEPLEYNGVQDSYTIAFLNGLSYTENCYSCKYATIKRGSDITLGDSWSYTGVDSNKGVSLILIQTKKGESLISNNCFVTKDIDINLAISTNHQLEYPSERNPKRKYFIENYEKGFEKAVKKSLPKKFYKQRLKKILKILKIYK